MPLTLTTLVRTDAEADALPWWRGATIYQIFPRSFADSNGDGDGDLPGITARLDYVASLGVDAIWLSPFFTSPLRDSGYDVADYRAVDPMFGTLDDFDRLLARAHALGLKVLIDQVYAHSSDQHRWFTDSRQSRSGRHADWYVWADAKPEGSPPNNWQSVFGGPAWTWDARRGQYYMHNFLREQPQLNLHNPEVQAELVDTARFWLDRGVDGFRIDAINFAMHDPLLRDNPPAAPGGRRTRPFDFQQHIHNQSHTGIPAFLERLRALFDCYPGTFTVAEVGGDDATREMKAFAAGETRLHSAYGFDFLYAEALTPALVRKTISDWPGRPGEGWPSWELSNHDAPRFVSRWAAPGEEDAVAQLGLLLLTALRGNAIVWQGEELGLTQATIPFERLRDPEAIANWPQTLGRDGARTPMPWQSDALYAGFSSVEPWLPIAEAHRSHAIDAQEADPNSVLHFARRALALRRDLPALRWGDIAIVDGPADLLRFERRHDGETLTCVFNLGSAPLVAPGDKGEVILSTGGADPGQPILPPRSGYIARLMQ